MCAPAILLLETNLCKTCRPSPRRPPLHTSCSHTRVNFRTLSFSFFEASCSLAEIPFAWYPYRNRLSCSLTRGEEPQRRSERNHGSSFCKEPYCRPVRRNPQRWLASAGAPKNAPTLPQQCGFGPWRARAPFMRVPVRMGGPLLRGAFGATVGRGLQSTIQISERPV